MQTDICCLFAKSYPQPQRGREGRREQGEPKLKKKKKKKHTEFIIRNSSNSENTGKITKDPTTEK